MSTELTCGIEAIVLIFFQEQSVTAQSALLGQQLLHGEPKK
jgi:hypothetical protein